MRKGEDFSEIDDEELNWRFGESKKKEIQPKEVPCPIHKHKPTTGKRIPCSECCTVHPEK